MLTAVEPKVFTGNNAVCQVVVDYKNRCNDKEERYKKEDF